MKRLLLLAVLLPLIMAPRGGNNPNQPVNLLPACTATSGACPSDMYFCQSSNVLWFCTSPNTWAKITVADGAITLVKMDDIDTPADGECLTYDSASGSFEWDTCGTGGGGGGTDVALDLGDDGDDSTAIVRIIVDSDDTNSVFTMSPTDTLNIDPGMDWPKADLADAATALAADPANCTAGSAAGGITAAGVAESCLDPIVATEIDTEAELQTVSNITNIIISTEIDTFAELDALAADKALVNKADGGTFADSIVIDGADAGDIQLRIQGAPSQSANIFVVEDSTGADFLTVNASGQVDIVGADGSAGWTLINNTSVGGEPGAGPAGKSNLYFYNDGTDTNLYLHPNGITNPYLVPYADDSAKRGVGFWCDTDTHANGDACCPGLSVCLITLDPTSGAETACGSAASGSASGWYLAICRAG